MEILKRASGACIFLDILPIVLHGSLAGLTDAVCKEVLFDLSKTYTMAVFIGTMPKQIPLNKWSNMIGMDEELQYELDICATLLEENKVDDKMISKLFATESSFVIPNPGHVPVASLYAQEIINYYSLSMKAIDQMPKDISQWKDDQIFEMLRKYLSTDHKSLSIPSLPEFIPLIVSRMPGYFNDLMSRLAVITAFNKKLGDRALYYTGVPMMPVVSMRCLGTFIEPYPRKFQNTLWKLANATISIRRPSCQSR